MGKVLEFRTTLERLSAESLITQRQLSLRQNRVVVPAEEFAGYRWQKIKYGTVGGAKAHRPKITKGGGGR